MKTTDVIITGAVAQLPLPPVERSSGLYVWVAGERTPYIDLVQGFSVTNWGHRHPKIVKAATDALRKVDHFSGAVDAIRTQVVDRLLAGVGLADGDAYFDVGGAQIVRISLHVATLATGRTKTACLSGSFHGHGCTGASLSSSFLSCAVPRRPCGQSLVLNVGTTDSIRRILKGDLAAVLVEPIQGAAGFIPLPRDWLGEVARACRDSRTLLISDEIQVGLGRTGGYSSLRQEGLEADIYLFGKALGGGVFPLSALLARKGILPGERTDSVGLGSTFTDNQVGMRVANVVLNLLDQSLASNEIAQRGQAFAASLRTAVPGEAPVRIRSHGLAVAVDFATSREAIAFWEAARRQRVLTHITGLEKNMVKMFPPFNIDQRSTSCITKLLSLALEDCFVGMSSLE